MKRHRPLPRKKTPPRPTPAGGTAPDPDRNPELRGLNPEQRRAVTTTEGPLLVLAGAGTGKTRVITHRIAHLLARRVPPEHVLAVTFTNKAAGEMRERVAALVGTEAARRITLGTFHSFCARALRAHAGVLGLHPRFGICDEADRLSAVKSALRDLRVGETSLAPREVLARISLAKNRLQTWEQFDRAAADGADDLVARAWRCYEDRLRRSRVLDFDDLLLRTVELLSRHAEVRKAFEARFRYVLVDEYQDTNGPQYEILRLLAGGHRNLCVVGDDDQSIYGWRGADIRKILNFERDFPGAAVVRLETNYRSTPQILQAANTVIRHNVRRHEKTLRAAVEDGPPVRVLAVEDENHEAELVVEDLLAETRAGRSRLGEAAILFRTQVQPRAFEVRLRALRIPYVVVGGMSFFDRKEVRDVLAYLKLMANPADEASLLRVVNVPPRGVGDRAVDRLLEAAGRQGISFGAVLDREDGLEGVPEGALRAARGFRRLLADLAPRAEGTGLPEAIRDLLRAVDYRAEVDRCYPDPVTREARWAGVEEILNFAENHVRSNPQATLTGFLEELSLTADDREEDGRDARWDAVTLMTLHAAKGLEFSRVYLVGVEEGLLPHQRSIEEDAVEEERRLMYVGITRARRVLTITWARSRARRGRRVACRKSRFLYELDGKPFVESDTPAGTT